MANLAANAPGAIHIVLQSKGGVGKSFVALHLAQYFADQGLPLAAFDSDPVTPTLSGYDALRPRYFNFMSDEDDIDVLQFDVLATEILNASEAIVVLDTGSSNFVPMVSYFKTNRVLQTFSKKGRQVILHSVLVGGASARETFGCLLNIVDELKADGYVAWFNSLFGPVLIDDRPIEEFKAFERVRGKLSGIVRIREHSGGSNVLHQRAIREMTRRNLTYKETLATPEISLWDKQRLWEARREVNDQLAALFGGVVAPMTVD